ncbi:MAG: chemotaxis protein CheW [Rehaibacterium terrae]|uniref:chemotaxis protein CheW n=1 Tax=Rehaibacterium terrae TaxID=1341696 RepID=UPI0039191C49
MSSVSALDDYLAGLMAAKAAEAVPAAAPAPAPAAAPAPAPASAPASEIGDDEFEALLDALHGKGGAPGGAVPADAPAPAAVVPPPAPAPVPRDVPAGLLAGVEAASSPFVLAAEAAHHGGDAERRRRAGDRTTAWLRFALAEQYFAVEVLKVQEVLRVPDILPLRGAAPAMIGMMNLRGQIVPVLDLAMRLGLPRQVPDETSRVVVLEEHGDTLGLLVRSVADVVSISDAAIESLSGPLALEGADVMTGIARRERSVTVLLDARRLLLG